MNPANLNVSNVRAVIIWDLASLKKKNYHKESYLDINKHAKKKNVT